MKFELESVVKVINDVTSKVAYLTIVDDRIDGGHFICRKYDLNNSMRISESFDSIKYIDDGIFYCKKANIARLFMYVQPEDRLESFATIFID